SALYDVDVESEVITLLTSGPGYYLNAVWSPNHRYLLYTQAQPKAALYLLDSQTGQTMLLYTDTVNIYDTPTWSSDSHSILFTRFVNNYRGQGDTGIFQLDVEVCLQQFAKCI